MDWNGLAFNLLSEAIGIAVTVLVIDRLLEYREQRRWRAVREFFWRAVEEECLRLNDAFGAWLRRIRELAPTIEGLERQPAAHATSNAKPVVLEIPAAAPDLDTVGDFATFAARARPQEIVSFVDVFLSLFGPVVKHERVREDEVWSQLGQSISAPLARLEQLITTHSSLIEPQLAFAVLCFNRDLDYLRRGADLLAYVQSPNAALSDWSINLDKSMYHALLALLELNVTVRLLRARARRGVWWKFGRVYS
jgi:hypothetical protein